MKVLVEGSNKEEQGGEPSSKTRASKWKHSQMVNKIWRMWKYGQVEGEYMTQVGRHRGACSCCEL